MANEISKSTRISWSRDGAQIVASTDERISQVGKQSFANVQIVGGTAEAIGIGDVTGACYMMLKNINPKWTELTEAEKATYLGKTDYDTKNTVYINFYDDADPTSEGYDCKLIPGAGTCQDSYNPTFLAIKDTNDVNLMVLAVEL